MNLLDIGQFREQSDELRRLSNAGQLALITDQEGPICLAVPFDDLLLKCDLRLNLAVRLFDDELISLGKAAELAGLSLSAFMDHLCSLGIPVARPRPGELEQELAEFA